MEELVIQTKINGVSVDLGFFFFGYLFSFVKFFDPSKEPILNLVLGSPIQPVLDVFPVPPVLIQQVHKLHVLL